MRKCIILFLLLCSFCYAATLRVAVLTDLHATAETADGGGGAIFGDGSHVRVYSNWSQRLTEFITAAKLYNADIIILLGDSIDNSVTDKDALWDTVLAQVASEWGDNAFAPVLGNHERVTGGDQLTVTQFATRWDNNMGTSWAAISSPWPSLKAFHRVSNYLYLINADFGIMALTGTLKAGASAVHFSHWDTAIVEDYDAGLNTASSGLNWMANVALGNLGTRHVIAINHHPLQSNAIGLDMPDRIISGTPDDGEDNLQDQLSGHSQPVTFLSGHYHSVTPAEPKFKLDTTTISNVNDLMLRGSVLGRSANDMRGNTFYIIDIDKTDGPVNIRAFQYSRTARDRYNPFDIDAVVGTDDRRGRH